MSKFDSEFFTGFMMKLLMWCARLFLIPFAAITANSLKLVWFGISENRPEIVQAYTQITLLGFFVLLLAMYYGFYSSSDLGFHEAVKELRVELAQLRVEVEELKEQIT
jgi:energy-coupling factor transporter transmembrane protein EcfT